MIHFGHDITGAFDSAARREWLVTNGLGSWASGTVSGANTRRYHGLFVPALKPPLARAVLVNKFNEKATINGQVFPLSSNEYSDGTIDPHGYTLIETFRLDGTVPTWVYTFGAARLEKRVWMVYGQDATYVTYTLQRSLHPVSLEVTAMVTGRDAHTEIKGYGWQPHVAPVEHGARPTQSVGIHTEPAEFHLLSNRGTFSAARDWHWNIKHRAETARGLPDTEDYFNAGTFTAQLQPGETLAFVISLQAEASLDWEAALEAEHARAQRLIAQADAQSEPEWIQQLLLAADQFLVKRGAGVTVIAGYHWFSDWGRDTMIALPGLTLATHRYAEAAAILRTFAHYVSEGMLPNRFPDVGEAPEYNTVDATLWYFHAIDRYLAVTGDEALARELLPILQDIIGWHLRGTRYQIHMDENDGLIWAGEPGVQLTWMDAKVDDWVVTPRIGKPVEINALWVNALRVAEALCARLGEIPAWPYVELAARATASFEKFWYADGGYLYDVLDGPSGPDHALRPNQLFALSLPHGPFAHIEDLTRLRSILEVCAAHLLTSYGLRSLAPNQPGYSGSFGGDRRARDGAYHQGAVWGWLIGPFADAYRRVYGDGATARAAARSFVAGFEQHLADDGLGSIAEIFEGDAPFAPRACIAQAWSVAEVLRVWRENEK
jgi:predicted glycogen debranching enzyme